MRTNLSNKVTASAFSVLLALSLGACGGSSDAESTTTDDNAAETTEIVDEDAKEEVTDEGDVENAAIDYMTYDEYLASDEMARKRAVYTTTDDEEADD